MTAEHLAADARSVRIEDEVTRRGIRLQGRGTDRAGPCPVCGGTDRFGVNIKKQMFYCRKCDVGGDVITFVRHVDGCTFKEAVNLLTGGHTPPQKPATGARHGAAGHRDSGGPAKAADNAATAAWLWGLREPISEDCPAGLYLRRTRGYHGPIPSTLGYLPANGKHHPPAMMAAFGFCEEPEPGRDHCARRCRRRAHHEADAGRRQGADRSGQNHARTERRSSDRLGARERSSGDRHRGRHRKGAFDPSRHRRRDVGCGLRRAHAGARGRLTRLCRMRDDMGRSR